MANSKGIRRVPSREAIADVDPPSASPEPLDIQIRNLAYQLWLGRGCPVGSPEVDWLEAEEKVKRPQTQTNAA
jgi:hypothetical protein